MRLSMAVSGVLSQTDEIDRQFYYISAFRVIFSPFPLLLDFMDRLEHFCK